MEAYDVTIVGAGPAGAAAAYACATKGLRTLLVERQSLQRPKVCGGLITHTCVQAIQVLFHLEVPSSTFVEPGTLGVYIIPPTGLKDGYSSDKKKILNVSRLRFDYWLTSCALGAGAKGIGNAEFVDVRESGNEGLEVNLRTDGSTSKFVTKYLVGCDGVYSRVRRALLPEYPNAIASIVQDYFEDTGPFENYFYVFFRRDISPAYAYVVVKDGRAVLGLGRISGIEPSIDEGMFRFRHWLARDFAFREDGFDFREGWSIPFGSVAYGKGNAILIGDAGGFCHPLTGEGILYGIRGAALVPQAIQRAESSGLPLVEEYRPLVQDMAGIMVKFRDYVAHTTAADMETLAQQKLKALEAFS